MRWPSLPIKRVAVVVMGQSPPSESVNATGDGMPFLQGNAEFGVKHPTPRLWCRSPAKRCEVGDLLISVRAPVGAKNQADAAYGVGRGLCAIRPRNVSARYLWHAADAAIGELRAVAQGSTYEAVSVEDVGAARVPVPPTEVQERIADYLDRETSRIDALVTQRRRLVHLLAERSQAAATRLLLGATADHLARDVEENPKFEDVPILSLRQAGVTAHTGPFGTQFAASEYVTGGVPMINPTHIRDGHIEPDDDSSLPQEVAERLSRYALSPGDIVLGRKGEVGRSALVERREEGWIAGSDAIVLRTASSRLHPRFLVNLLHLDVIRQQLEAKSTGATLANVNESILLSLRIPVPSLENQRQRTSAAESVADKARRLVEKLESQAALLLKHRRALITAAVTGQLDVTRAA